MAPPSSTAIARYRAAIERIRIRTAAGLASVWDDQPGYDAANVASFARTAAPILEAAKTATATSSAGFYALILNTPPPGLDIARIPAAADVRQPFTATWHALSEGRPYDEAVRVGRSAMEAVGDSFVQSTARLTGDAVAETVDRTIRWRRVAEPGACDWCQERDGTVYPSAADGDYGHERCHCDVIPE